MKITKSMIYTPSPEATELYVCTVNNGDVYPMIKAVYTNLLKKYHKGIYDHEAAKIAWYHVAEAENCIYKRDFGYSFTVTERYTVAVDLEAECYDHMVNGETEV